MNLESVRRDDWILAGVALLLAIDLLAFTWFSGGGGTITVNGFAIGSFSINLTGVDAPDGWTAVLAVIALFVLIADLALERLAPQVTVPAIGNSRVMTRFALAVVAAFFIFLKFVLNIHFSIFGYGFWLAVPLTIALVYFAIQSRNAGDTAVSRPAAGPPASGPPSA
jgi:hypothetical protein